MKNLAICLLLFSAAQAAGIEVVEEKPSSLSQDEVSSLQELISTNERRLQAQKTLKEKMEHFCKQKEEFLQGNQTKSHTFSMVSNARDILVSIKEEHLSYLFGSDYLEELLFFSSVAAKSVPLKP